MSKADALYIRLDKSDVVESEEVHPGVILDFDDRDQVVGIEILNVKNRIALTDLNNIQVNVSA
ncbi:MAG: DUF2283 domain-containing protein [Plectolyngbya sp. WJT66-NPBG17]|jgi:uncharacterized protein YuzE|nr:DUF2283 domain-containing protein [Plectolyngbya sp. WJT66-NPBG17]